MTELMTTFVWGLRSSVQLWMGTHPSCPSLLLSDSSTLKDFLATRPELLGEKVVKKFGKDLPFLFKVRVGVW